MNTGGSWLTICGAVFAGLGVALGAFAAHSLSDVFGKQYADQTRMVAGTSVPAAQKYLADFKTGAEYQLIHALALCVLGLLPPTRAKTIAGCAFVAGIVLFSGSLYALTLTGITRFGMVTPLGGLGFLIGWGAFAVAASRR